MYGSFCYSQVTFLYAKISSDKAKFKETKMNENESKSFNRRCLLKAGTMGLFAVPFLSMSKAIAAGCSADAAACKKGLMDKTDKRFKKYEYTLDAGTAKAHKKFKPNANCGNCNFYKIKKEKNSNAPCAMLGQKCVVSCGWCNKWMKSKRYKKA